MRFCKCFLAVVLLVSMTLIYISTVDAATAPKQTKPGFAFPTENVTIEIWWHEYGPFTAYVKELIEAYKKVRPNVTINPCRLFRRHQSEADGRARHGHRSRHHGQRCVVLLAYYTKGVLEPLNLDVFGAKSYPELAAPIHARRARRRHVRRENLRSALPGQFDEPVHQQQGVRRCRARPGEGRAQDLGRHDGARTQAEEGQGNRTVQKAFDFPYHSPRWEVQNFQPLVEQFGGKILSDDGKTAYHQQPRGGEGADPVA